MGSSVSPKGWDTRAAVQAAAATGLRLADIDDHRTTRSPERALVLGYGNITDSEIPPAVALLREVSRSATAPGGRVRGFVASWDGARI